MGAREGREERCSAGHRERNSGKVRTAAGIEMWPLPSFTGSTAWWTSSRRLRQSCGLARGGDFVVASEIGDDTCSASMAEAVLSQRTLR